ncbi:MAG TPA: hypothetical protein VEL07_18970 [Planctomycetota bacterium]|nr:hypothetical protein [Planctomycetota bacterium]
MGVLSAAEIERFERFGFIKLDQVLDPAVIARCADRFWTRVGYDRHDPSTWREARMHLPVHEDFAVRDVAPRAYHAMLELCGGAERVAGDPQWGDAFIANLGVRADQPWVPPSPAAGGWHKDGDFFRHFLDSPEQGLLTIVLWSDVVERGGATFLACDSVAPVARHLAAHPEGVHPDDLPFKRFIAECTDFREATGRAGDVYLLHPYILHATSGNVLRRPRLITNPPITLREPMRFDRVDGQHSPVERAILRALGVERLAFRPAAQRQRIVPERVLHEQRLRREELARLARKQHTS